MDGILEIQSGTNPRMLEEKLMNYLSPNEQKKLDKLEDSKKGNIANEQI
jgi:chemotaxis protein MotA